MTSVDPWWTDPFGLPGRTEDQPPRASRPIVLLLIAAMLLGVLGVLVASRHDDSGMKAFCTAYRDVPTPSQPTPARITAADLDSPKVKDAMDSYQEALRLARASGNARIVASFAAHEADLSRAPGSTPDEQMRNAQREAEVFVASFKAAVEECEAAGYPIVNGGAGHKR